MIRWSANLAYAVGLITTDGCLSKDGRHIILVSKDLEQLQNFSKILSIRNKFGTKKSGYNPNGTYYVLQSGDVKLHRFLLTIGLIPNKSKTLGQLGIPDKYFTDFLRGHLDGDGYTNSYFDPRWKSSFMLYTGFISASEYHLKWLQSQIKRLHHLDGKITKHGKVSNLRFAKKASTLLLEKIYYKTNLICLERKRFKIRQALDIIHKRAGVL